MVDAPEMQHEIVQTSSVSLLSPKGFTIAREIILEALTDYE
jgi:hypothetical protein